MTTIKILQEDIRLRPSAVDGFFGCAYQWGKHFLEGISSIPGSRAAIGTSIHAAAEQCWNESIRAGKKEVNLGAMNDAAMEAWKEEAHKGIQYGDNEDEGTCAVEIIKGTEAFAEDIVPFSKIPVATEKFFKVDIEHPLITELGGTVDYITDTVIADLKTSKRKPTVSNYSTQQSIYTYLAVANGIDVQHNLIQAVVMKKVPEGMVLPMEADVDSAKILVNTILDTLDYVAKDIMPIELLLRPNPKYMFCSNKFCNFYGNCPATKAKELQATRIAL